MRFLKKIRFSLFRNCTRKNFKIIDKRKLKKQIISENDIIIIKQNIDKNKHLAELILKVIEFIVKMAIFLWVFDFMCSIAAKHFNKI